MIMIMKQLKEYIDAIVSRIFDRLDTIESKIDGFKKHIIDGREMIDGSDVCKILKISKRSIYRYRRSGELRPRKLGGKLYYDLEDVRKLIQKIMN